MNVNSPTIVRHGTWPTPWGAHPSYELVSASLAVTVLPQFGGKIVSIRRLSDSAEFLLQPQQPYRALPAEGDFATSDLGGFDECFPSVSPIYKAGRTTVPDHGDLWRVPWTVSQIEDSLLLMVEAGSVPVRFQRRLSLEGDTLHIDYELHNLGDDPHSFIYAAHPLLQVDEGDRILLPEEVDRVRLEGWTLDDRLADTSLTWPTAKLSSGATHDLSSIGPLDGKSAAKLFAGPLSTGRAGLYRSKLHTGIMVSFDAQQLPWLGVWICHGAWPAESAPTRHYTVALEPTTSPCDSLGMAKNTGSAAILNPRSPMRWRISLAVLACDHVEGFQRLLDQE